METALVDNELLSRLSFYVVVNNLTMYMSSQGIELYELKLMFCITIWNIIIYQMNSSFVVYKYS